MSADEQKLIQYDEGDLIAQSKMVVDKTGAVPLWMAKALANGLVTKLYERGIPLTNVSFHFGIFEEGKKVYAMGGAMAIEPFETRE